MAGQTPYLLTFGIGPLLDFEDTSSTKYFYIDSTISNNIWTIGQPQKIFMDSAYSFYKAIITDTINPYPVNNFSIFSMTLLRQEGFLWINFHHKFDSDSLKDGGNIEISLDGGFSWGNVIDSAFLANYNMSFMGAINFYSAADTVTSLNNLPGFSGTSNGWQTSEFSIYYQDAPFYLDTFLIRFVFASDSINTNREGWLIDDLIIGANHVGVNEVYADNIYIYPNPTTGIINIDGIKGMKEVVFYSSLGQEILRRSYPNDSSIDISNFTSGIYAISIKADNRIIVRKIIKT